jgi:methionyl-tRNA synthetase
MRLIFVKIAMMSKYYITTSIPYVNGDPHLGHAMEFVEADVLARYYRQRDYDVVFSTGTDEHGGKIAEKANELKLTPEQLADQYSQRFKDLMKDLNISNNRFIRTTDPAHEQRAQIIWKNISEYIYKGSYEGWYCTGDEEYFSEQVVKANNGISVSRPKNKISWGILVPGDDSQVMYVWFEALLNYITVLGYPEHKDFKKYWPADMQVIGKGIIRFHAAIWPGILMALGLPLQKNLYVHGYVTVGGGKMSKSLGNSIAPDEIIKKYGADTFRYFFTRHIPSYGDGDFTWERLEAAYNNELADQLGNAVSRTAAMISKYQAGLIGEIPEAKHDLAQYEQSIENCQFDRALEEVWDQVRGLNQYIDETKPWELAKLKDEEHLREVLAYMVSSLLEIADLLVPFTPDTAEKIKATFSSGVLKPLPAPLFPKEQKPKTEK